MTVYFGYETPKRGLTAARIRRWIKTLQNVMIGDIMLLSGLTD